LKSTTNLDFPRLIKDLRKKRNLTQQQLASKINVALTTINNWEHGHYKPQKIMHKKLLKMSTKAGLDLKKYKMKNENTVSYDTAIKNTKT